MAQSQEQLIEELRAECEALKRVMIAQREKRGTAIDIAMRFKDGKIHWIVTCPWPVMEQRVAEAIADHITTELAKAFVLTEMCFTGTSTILNSKPTDEAGA